MLEKYKVVKEKNEDVLYLYLSMNYEFAKDLDDYNLDNLDKNWLINQRIQFNGNKVVIFVDGIPTKVVLLNDNDKILSDKDIILFQSLEKFIRINLWMSCENKIRLCIWENKTKFSELVFCPFS